MIIILFGVAGVGKTVVGRALAAELSWTFYDADDFHPPANIEKMSRGVPLSDEDRRPWLERLRELLETCLAQGVHAVLACSALKESYRRLLRVSDEVKLVYLKADYAVIAARMKERRGHFMPPELLRSQFATLEEPKGDAYVIDATPAPAEVVRAVRRALQL